MFGHPQFGLAKLLRKIGLNRADVVEIGVPAAALAARGAILGRSAAAGGDDRRLERRSQRLYGRRVRGGPRRRRRSIEAANERDEALTIATALRGAIVEPKATAALVTTDRDLARRVSAELLRFGIRADDSGGTPLTRTPPGEFLALLLEAVFRPGNPVPIAALAEASVHCGLAIERSKVRHAAETIELVALRGGTGRPDVAALAAAVRGAPRLLCHGRPQAAMVRADRQGRSRRSARVLARLVDAIAPLAACRGGQAIPIAEIARATIVALEALGA